jgi:hypothetical protein
VAARAAASDEGLVLVHNLDECSHSVQCERHRPDNHVARIHSVPGAYHFELSPHRMAPAPGRDERQPNPEAWVIL